MKNVKVFFLHIKKSIIPHHLFYRTIKRQHFSDSLKFFIGICTAISFFFLLAVTMLNFPTVVKFKNAFVKSLYTYPRDLTIHIYNGNITSNYNRPYFHWLDIDNKKILFLVIDENARSEKINTYRAMIMLTHQSSVTRGENRMQDFKTTPIPSIGKDRVINRQTIERIAYIVDKWFFVGMIPFFIITFFLQTISLFLAVIMYILLVSLGTLILYRFFGKRLLYKNIIHVALHSSIIPVFLVLFLSFFSRVPLFFSYIHIFLFLIFLITAVYETYCEHPSQPVHKPRLRLRPL